MDHSDRPPANDDRQAIAEIWKQAPGIPYEVSSLGRARRIGGRPRKLKIHRGYRFLSIANGRGSSKNVSMARLVCEAFNGPPPPGADVDHIDRDRSNDRPHNLRWVTRAENLENRKCASGTDVHGAILDEQLVQLIRSSSENSIKLGARLGVAPRTIRDVRNNVTWRNAHA